MRRIVEDYEAKLRPPAGQRGKGKVEWERYGDGSEEFHARFRKLDLPDGASVEVRVEGAVVGYVNVADGGGRLRIESTSGEEVPKAVEGQVAEVVRDDQVLLAGVFEPD